MKRLIDIVLSSVGLLLTAPILALGALAVWLEDGRPIFLVQPRAGRGGGPIPVFKLRTMVVHDPSERWREQVGPGHPLVLRCGEWLRRFHIDELPQLLNVLRGEMSLVGPRPCLLQHAAELDGFQRIRFSVKPGCTGWAQVHGLTDLSWEDRIRLDVWYVGHRGLLLDLTILLWTVPVLLTLTRAPDRALEEAREHEARIRSKGQAPQP